jgi:hypothetical protein
MKTKPKILLVGWESHLWSLMKERELKGLDEQFEIIFARLPVDAFHEIAKANFVSADPIQAIVFQRESLIFHQELCKKIAEFAELYNKSRSVFINLIENDQDREARDYAVIGTFVKENNWQHVQTILNKNLKRS